MGDNIREILEELRIRMHMNMTESMGIPRLDPFTISEVSIDPETAGAMGLDG